MPFLVAYSSDRRKKRGYHIGANVAMAIIDFIISMSTINSPTHYVAPLNTTGSPSANALVCVCAVSNLSQAPEKRAAGGTIVNIMKWPLRKENRRVLVESEAAGRVYNHYTT
ncbi:hypothetical protein ACJ41O_015309 [Fusarium nematophilum]